MELPTNTTAPTTTTAGEPHVVGSYRSDVGERQLVAQRIDGRVALSDIPTGDDGCVHLIERYVTSKAELDGLAAAYLEHAEQLGGHCPMEDRLI
jgi:hypothetical protein